MYSTQIMSGEKQILFFNKSSKSIIFFLDFLDYLNLQKYHSEIKC